MTAIRLAGVVNPLVKNAVDRLSESDVVTWEVEFTGRAEVGLIVAVFVSIPSPIVGQQLGNTRAFSPFGLTQELVDGHVQQQLSALRAERSRLLSA